MAGGLIAVPEALERALENRVLTLWGGVLGVDAGVLDQDGLITVEDRRDFAAQRRGTIRTARGTLLLAAPSEKQIALADPAAYCRDVTERARGTGFLHYLADPLAGDRDPRVRVLAAGDRPLLDALQAAAGADATEEAEVDVEDPVAVGIDEDGRLLAIASLLEESGDAIDVGVLVDPASADGASELRLSATSPSERQGVDGSSSTAATVKTRRRRGWHAHAGSPSGAC